MRILAGALKGRALATPPGLATRPTAQRMRQAVFDILMHAPWGGRALLEGARVLDGFAGTGAMGLEALSRGAGEVVFIEQDRAALAVLRANIAGCGVAARARLLAADMRRPPSGSARALVFLDPPYGQGLVPAAVAALGRAGWIGPGTIMVTETELSDHSTSDFNLIARRVHGAAQVTIWRPDAGLISAASTS